ncbi:MAG: hypothetical protein AB1611_04570 [bacterium]
MVKHFPHISLEMITHRGQDRNPAIQLFGRRFFVDQTVPELLVEFLLVASSAKKIGNTLLLSKQVFPYLDLLRAWPDKVHLDYTAKACLNLKLFAFLGASKLETRHQSHREHYHKLRDLLSSQERLVVSSTAERTEVLRTLENLFLGFQGVGSERTWCAQSFLPLIRELIGGESIWRETRAKDANVQGWGDALDFFSHNQQLFLARGGELLYLQICNALRQEESLIEMWNTKADLGLSKQERTPECLHKALEDGISGVLNACPKTLGKLATFIDSGVDPETSKHTDKDENGNPRFTRCGWCPAESWQEGLLFAVELLRLCDAAVDPIERLELLEIACAMQVLRSLCAQSARYVDWPQAQGEKAGPLAFVWAVSDPEGRDSVLKQISRRSVSAIQRMIYDAIRHPDIRAVVAQQEREDRACGQKWVDPYKEADGRYGYKLFLTLAKRIGLVVPKRGTGARFVLNDRLLRFLVMSVIRPGERVTYETFKKLVFTHYGIALDSEKIGQACEWHGATRLTMLDGNLDAWVVEMLNASGVLIRLSDSCSLVTNPFDGRKNGL